MRTERFQIHTIPAVLYGPPSGQGYLYPWSGRQQGRSCGFCRSCRPRRVSGFGYRPAAAWRAQSHDRRVYPVGGRAGATGRSSGRKNALEQGFPPRNSIGAFFPMLAFQEEPVGKALFVSPIVDMERLILDMMGGRGSPKRRSAHRAKFRRTLARRFPGGISVGAAASSDRLENAYRYPLCGTRSSDDSTDRHGLFCFA